MTLIDMKPKPYVRYSLKAELKRPWIRCLWCEYTTQIEFDLSIHYLEKHKDALSQIPISKRERIQTNILKGPEAYFYSKFEGAIEFRLDVAVEMAKDGNRGKVPKHAISIIQKRIIDNRREAGEEV